MKKIIFVKNKKLKESLVESSIKVGEKDYANRLRRRITDLRRVSQMAKEAAEKAEAKGETELAKKLRTRAEEIEALIAKANMDSLDDTEVDDTILDSEEDNATEDEIEDSEEEEDTTGDEYEDEAEKDATEDDPEQNDDTEDTLKRDSQDDNDDSSDTEDSKETSSESDLDTNTEDTGTSDDTSSDSEEEDDTTGDEDSDDDTEGDTNREEEESEGEKTDSEDENTEDETESTTDEEGTDATDDSDVEGDGEEESEDDNEDSDGDNEEDTEETGESDDQKNGKGNNSSEDDPQETTDDDDEDGEESETEDDPVKDPFADEEDIPSLDDLLGGMGTQEPRDATLKDIIKQLKALTGESKQGAIAGLQEIINSRKPTTESLTEAVKGVREMTDDEFGDYLNSTYDLIDQAEALEYIDEKELKDKKTKVGQWTTDPKTLKELEAEGDFVVSKDVQKVVARDKEKQKYTKVGTLEQFKLNFYRAISNQVEMVRQEVLSYLEINPEYESEDVIVKAEIMKEIPDIVIPTVDVYFDVSASWGPEEIEIGKKAIASVKSYEDAGELKINLFYFGNEVRSTPDGCGPGTKAWRKILQNIAATKARNVLIITDGDMNEWGVYGALGGPTLKVDGCVWFLWRDGITAPECVKHLIGKEGNYQYAFYMNDFK